MTIEQNFHSFLHELQYTHNQREDAKKKYTGVCKSVATHFLGEEYNDNMKFLFGSYKTGARQTAKFRHTGRYPSRNKPACLPLRRTAPG